MMLKLSLVLVASPTLATLLLLLLVLVVVTTLGTQAGVPSSSLHTVHSKVRVETSTAASTLLPSQHTDTISTGQH